MTNILFVDSSFEECRALLIKNSELIRYEEDIRKIRHSEKILVMIDSLLEISQIKIVDIDIFSCIYGPGTFTGVRIGLETIKAFSYSLQKKLIIFNNFDILAAGAAKYCKKKKLAMFIQFLL